MKKVFGLCTSGIIVNAEKNVLIVKRSDADDFLPGYWELPGGGLEYGEHPNESVVREVLEECGVEIDRIQPFSVHSHIGYEGTKREMHYIEIFYLCETQVRNPKVTISFEHSDYRWITLDEAQTIHMTDYTKNVFNELKKHQVFVGVE